ncbi:MAG: lipid II flippase MurJ [Patescibacteria group bacterium]|nr:lipid II flippase MurJ [Patescibacteria group bacterium]
MSRETSGLHSAALLLAGSALASQLLGLLRDRLLAHTFGASTELDLYFAAFRIPDLIFVGFTSLVSLSVLIPVLARVLERGSEEARRFLDSMFTVFLVAMLLVCTLAYLALPALVRIFFSGFPTELAARELVELSRMLLLSPLLLGISSLFAGITQTHRVFMLYALSPLFYNVGIICGVLFLYPIYGLGGLGAGVILGALFHASIQLPFLLRRGLLPRLTLRPAFRNVRRVFVLSLPRSLALSAQQIAMLVLVSLATRLSQGSVAALSLSFNLQSVPLSIIGVAYATAAFPTLARLAARGEREVFLERVASALRHVIFWSLPVLVLFIVLRAHLVRLILGSGAFDWDATRLVAALLAAFGLSIVAQSVNILLLRAWYALGETWKPLMAQFFSAFITIAFAMLAVRSFEEHTALRTLVEQIFRIEGVRGSGTLALALSFSIGSLAGATALWIFFERKVGGLFREIRGSLFESALASVLLGGTVLLILRLFAGAVTLSTFWGVLTHVALAALGGVTVALSALIALRNRELLELVHALKSRIRSPTPIAVEMRM